MKKDIKSVEKELHSESACQGAEGEVIGEDSEYARKKKMLTEVAVTQVSKTSSSSGNVATSQKRNPIEGSSCQSEKNADGGSIKEEEAEESDLGISKSEISVAEPVSPEIGPRKRSLVPEIPSSPSDSTRKRKLKVHVFGKELSCATSDNEQASLSENEGKGKIMLEDSVLKDTVPVRETNSKQMHNESALQSACQSNEIKSKISSSNNTTVLSVTENKMRDSAVPVDKIGDTTDSGLARDNPGNAPSNNEASSDMSNNDEKSPVPECRLDEGKKANDKKVMAPLTKRLSLSNIKAIPEQDLEFKNSQFDSEKKINAGFDTLENEICSMEENEKLDVAANNSKHTRDTATDKRDPSALKSEKEDIFGKCTEEGSVSKSKDNSMSRSDSLNNEASKKTKSDKGGLAAEKMVSTSDKNCSKLLNASRDSPIRASQECSVSYSTCASSHTDELLSKTKEISTSDERGVYPDESTSQEANGNTSIDDNCAKAVTSESEDISTEGGEACKNLGEKEIKPENVIRKQRGESAIRSKKVESLKIEKDGSGSLHGLSSSLKESSEGDSIQKSMKTLSDDDNSEKYVNKDCVPEVQEQSLLAKEASLLVKETALKKSEKFASVSVQKERQHQEKVLSEGSYIFENKIDKDKDNLVSNQEKLDKGYETGKKLEVKGDMKENAKRLINSLGKEGNDNETESISEDEQLLKDSAGNAKDSDEEHKRSSTNSYGKELGIKNASVDKYYQHENEEGNAKNSDEEHKRSSTNSYRKEQGIKNASVDKDCQQENEEVENANDKVIDAKNTDKGEGNKQQNIDTESHKIKSKLKLRLPKDTISAVKIKEKVENTKSDNNTESNSKINFEEENKSIHASSKRKLSLHSKNKSEMSGEITAGHCENKQVSKALKSEMSARIVAELSKSSDIAKAEEVESLKDAHIIAEKKLFDKSQPSQDSNSNVRVQTTETTDKNYGKTPQESAVLSDVKTTTNKPGKLDYIDSTQNQELKLKEIEYVSMNNVDADVDYIDLSSDEESDSSEAKVCKTCCDIWNDEVLRIIFKGTECVTVNSRITYGAIVCINNWINRNLTGNKEEAIINIFERADLGRNIAKLNISKLDEWLDQLLKSNATKCCDVFTAVYSSEKDLGKSKLSKGSQQLYEKGKKTQKVISPNKLTTSETKMPGASGSLPTHAYLSHSGSKLTTPATSTLPTKPHKIFASDSITLTSGSSMPVHTPSLVPKTVSGDKSSSCPNISISSSVSRLTGDDGSIQKSAGIRAVAKRGRRKKLSVSIRPSNGNVGKQVSTRRSIKVCDDEYDDGMHDNNDYAMWGNDDDYDNSYFDETESFGGNRKGFKEGDSGGNETQSLFKLLGINPSTINIYLTYTGLLNPPVTNNVMIKNPPANTELRVSYFKMKKERAALHGVARDAYDLLMFEAQNFETKTAGTKVSNRYVTKRELLTLQSLCILNAETPDANVFFEIFLQILLSRNQVLILPDSRTLLLVTEEIRKAYNRAKIKSVSVQILNESWDPDHLYCTEDPLLCKENMPEEPRVRDVLAVFCTWKNLEKKFPDPPLNKALQLLCKNVNIKGIDRFGICIQLFIKYCRYLYEEKNVIIAKAFLDEPFYGLQTMGSKEKLVAKAKAREEKRELVKRLDAQEKDLDIYLRTFAAAQEKAAKFPSEQNYTDLCCVLVNFKVKLKEFSTDSELMLRKLKSLEGKKGNIARLVKHPQSKYLIKQLKTCITNMHKVNLKRPVEEDVDIKLNSSKRLKSTNKKSDIMSSEDVEESLIPRHIQTLVEKLLRKGVKPEQVKTVIKTVMTNFNQNVSLRLPTERWIKNFAKMINASIQ